MQEIADRRVDVAHNHEAESNIHLSGEQVNRQKIKADNDNAIGERLDNRAAKCDGSWHHLLLFDYWFHPEPDAAHSVS